MAANELDFDEVNRDSVSSSNSGEPPFEAFTFVDKSTLSEEIKLEGWLKLSGLGFRKTCKQVWFVYGEDTGKLHYYLQPQDVMPVGEIDLRLSSLTYDASNREKPGLFQIRCGEKIYNIDAQEHVHMVSWLNALQSRRRAFSLKQSELAHDFIIGNKKRISSSGLLGETSEDSDIKSTHNSVSLHTEMDNTVPTNHSLTAGAEKLGSSSFRISTKEDWSIDNGRPLPPSSLPLANSFSTQPHTNFNESPVGSKDNEAPFIRLKSQNEPEHAEFPSEPCKTFANQSRSSQTLPIIKSKSLPLDDSQSPATSPVSPSSSNATIGKLKFMSVLRNNFKIMKDTVKEKKLGLLGKQISSTSSESTGNPLPYCYRCRSLDNELMSVKDELKSVKEELNTDRKNAGLLQKEVNVMKAVMNTRKECEGKSENEIMQVLDLKDKHIAELEHSLAALLDEKNTLVQELRQHGNTVKDLRDQICMFQQTLAVKDEIIISLTNTNQELENSSSPGLTAGLDEYTGLCLPFITNPIERKELERLDDMCKAYEDQNKFLTNEILELNTLRQEDEATERLLRMHIGSLEAQSCQATSKYLFLLNEMKTPVRGGDERTNQDIVNQLLQEALESNSESQDDDGDENRVFTSSQTKEYDCYGFLKWGHEDGNVLISRGNILMRQALDLEYQIRDADEETSKRVKWDNFMVGLPLNKQLIRSTDIKILLRQGIPHQFRERIWKGCINLHVKPTRIKLGNKYYKHLEERANNNKSNPAINQIELDLLRTLPDNKYFDKIDSPGIRKLRRVLLCYSIHNPFIGYCQGLNRIAAIALLFLCEEDAFWCLVAITEHLMPVDYYTSTLAAAQADQRVLKDLVQDKCPKLHSYLEAHDVDLSFFTFNWFLTVFVDGIFPELFLRVWDVFLYEGSKVLFRFALAFLKYGEDEILKQPNSLAINRYMRALGETITDVRKIYNIAFSELNPFPMRSILSKRNHHLQQVKLELEELEKIRGEFRSAHEEEERSQDDFSDDELEDEQQ